MESYNGPSAPKRRNPMFDQDATPAKNSSRPQKRAAVPPVPEKPTRRAQPAPQTAGAKRQAAPNRPDSIAKARPAQNSPGNRPAARNKNAAVARQAKKRKKRRRIIVALVVCFSLCSVLFFSVFAAYRTIQERIEPNADRGDGVLPDDIKTLPEFEGESVSFLVSGIAYDDDETGQTVDTIGNTDMILYVNFNLKDIKAKILQIPRDVYVGKELPTGGTCKINGLYRNAEDTENRMAALAKVINTQFGLPVDFYISIDMPALKEIVDIKGWIEVYVPMTVSDPDHPEARIEEGWRHLDSMQVEFLLRNRKSPTYNQQSDIARLRTQQSFYSALFREFKSLSPKDLLMWMNVLTYRCSTDMDLWDLGGIAQKALKLEGKDITFVRPACAPQQITNESGQMVSLVTLLPEEMAEVLNQHFRPEGDVKPLSALNIQSLPVTEEWGFVETEVKTMEEVQSGEAVPEST